MRASIQARVDLRLDVTIHLILGRLVPGGHRADTRAPPGRPTVLHLILLLNLSLQCLSFFYFLSLIKIFKNQLRRIQHLLVPSLFLHVFSRINEPVARDEFGLEFVPLHINFCSLQLLFLGRQLLCLSREYPFLELHFLRVDVGVLALHGQVEDPERVLHQLLFDLEIEGGLGGEAGSVVDLDEPGLEVGVEHDVEPENLKAELVLDVFGLAGAVDVPHTGLTRD